TRDAAHRQRSGAHLHRTRPTPLTPPYPYTTRFRSPKRMPRPLARSIGGAMVAEAFMPIPLARHPMEQGAPDPAREEQNEEDEESDRKRTRLNSSHVKSSYAAFCSKKTTWTVTETAT